jgi:hypothetical protein
MRSNSVTLLIAAIGLSLGTACAPNANEGRRHWPKPTPPPDASPVYQDVDEHIPTEEEIARDAEQHPARLEAQIESALLKGDAGKREIAFTFFLPELLQVEPSRVLDLFARLEPGQPRDLLRNEMARQWVGRDSQAAVSWMKSLQGAERRAAVVVAATELAPWAPQEAIQLVEEFGLGHEEPLRKLLSSLRQ